MAKTILKDEQLNKVIGGRDDSTYTCTFCWLNIPAGMEISSYCDHSADGKHNFVPTWAIPEDILKEHNL